jgi:hypothetical protein
LEDKRRLVFEDGGKKLRPDNILKNTKFTGIAKIIKIAVITQDIIFFFVPRDIIAQDVGFSVAMGNIFDDFFLDLNPLAIEGDDSGVFPEPSSLLPELPEYFSL